MKKINKFITKIASLLKRKTTKNNLHIVKTKPIQIQEIKKVSKNNDLEDIILKIIKSKNDFIKAKEIINQLINNFNKTEMPEPVLRYIITKLRSKNHPIIATKNGYKYSTNKKEINSYYTKRILEIQREQGVLNAIAK